MATKLTTKVSGKIDSKAPAKKAVASARAQDQMSHGVAAKSTESPSDAPFYKGGARWIADESLGYLARKLVISLQRHIDLKMQTYGLTHSQWSPLIWISNGTDTSGELARELDLDAGAMTRMVDRLEHKGMLKRVWRADDRRVAHLELTDDGRAVTAVIPDKIAAVLNHHLRGLKREDVLQMKSLLRQMLVNGRDPTPVEKAKRPSERVTKTVMDSKTRRVKTSTSKKLITKVKS